MLSTLSHLCLAWPGCDDSEVLLFNPCSWRGHLARNVPASSLVHQLMMLAHI